MENNFEKNWKYIVYKTTNLINNKIYIGVHKTRDPETFDGYLGCGVLTTQPYTYQNAKTAFQYAVKKYGPKNFVRHTIQVFDTEDEAFALEEEIVNEKFLEREDVYNMILGGKGGIFVTTRLKVYQYDIVGNFLKEYESFADAGMKIGRDYTSISLAVRKKCKIAGFYWSTDKLDRIDLDLYGNIPGQKRIFCYSKDGKFIGCYDTIQQCSNELFIRIGEINESCELGTCVKNQYYFSIIRKDFYDAAKTEYLKIREVFQYDGKTGNFIKSYDHQIVAEKENPKSNISKAIRLKSIDDNGYIWGLEKLKNYNTPKKKIKKRVGKYNLEGQLVTEFESATAAEKADGTSIWKVLNGTNQTHKQYIYKYL